MPILQTIAAMAWWPMVVWVSDPRTVSVTRVKGWYSANWRSPAGIVAVGTNPLPRKGSRIRIIGVLLAVSTLLATSPSATASQISREGEQGQDPDRGEPVEWPGAGVEPEAERDADEDADGGQGLDQAAEDVSGEDRAAGDGHRAEAIDDAVGHVHRYGERGAVGGRGDGDEQEAGDDVDEVGVPSRACAAETGAELAAEDIDEERQQHERHSDQHQRHRRGAQLVFEVASQHRTRESLRV